MVVLKKDSYPNSPVIEVTWEIRFNETTPIEADKIKQQIVPKMVEQIPDFVSYEDIHKGGFEVSDPMSKQAKLKQFPQSFIGIEFNDRDKKNIIKISIENLLIISRDHTNFKDFRKKVSGVVNILSDIFPDFSMKDVSRMGLRYINVCELPENNKNNVNKYLLLPIDLLRFPIETIGNFRYETLQHFGDISHRSVYSSIIIKDQPEILIDLDVFSAKINNLDNEENLRKSILKSTIDMHKIIKRSFQNSITEAFVNEVMERV